MGITHMVNNIDENLGVALIGLGRHREAIATLTAQIAAVTVPRYRVTAASHLARAHASAGDLDESLAVCERTFADADSFPSIQPLLLGVYARTLLGLGRTDEAVDAARRGMAFLEQLHGESSSWLENDMLTWLANAEALRARGDPAADALVARARDIVLERAVRLAGEHRERFVRDIPENAQLLELAAGD